MLIKSKDATRRGILKGMLRGGAVAMALPLLDIFLNDHGTAIAATGDPLPTRFGTWFWGLGVDHEIFTPKTAGANYELPPQMAALEKVKQHINVFTNFNVLTDGKPNLCHFSGWVALRCGAAPGARGELSAESLDVPIAAAMGGGVRFRSLNMAATGVPRDSYSFLSGDAINPPEVSVVELYQKLFGAEFQDPNSSSFTPDPRVLLRQSALSSVKDEAKAFENMLGASDRQRLDQYFTSVRELEKRVELQLQKPPPAPACVVPKAPAADLPVGLDIELVTERHKAMTDLLVMALACNQTRVFNMVFSDSFSALVRKGSERTHHILTHEEPIDPATQVQPNASWFVERSMEAWAYFVEALAKVPEGDGTLLDHSLVYAHSDCEFAKVHSLDGVPMFTAGKLGGKVKTGMHIDGNGDPGTRLGYTVQRLMGVPIDSWGNQSLKTSREIGEIVA